MKRFFVTAMLTVALALAVGVGVTFQQLSGSPPLAPGQPLAWRIGSTSGTASTTAPGASRGAWRVVDHLSGHHVAMIHVETDRPNDALRVATVLVEPLKADKYSEVLVYVHRVGHGEGMPVRRIQWSPRTGYIETVYGEPVEPGSTPADDTAAPSATPR